MRVMLDRDGKGVVLVRTSSATSRMDAAQALPPPVAALQAAFQALQQGRLPQARAQADALLPLHRDDPQLHYLCAELDMAEGRPQQALPHYRTAVAGAPGQWPLLQRLGQCLLSLRQRTAVREVAASLLAIDDPVHAAAASWAAARLLAEAQRSDQALQAGERALASGLDTPSLRYDLALWSHFLGLPNRAEAHLRQLLAKQPDHGPAMYLRACLRRQDAVGNNVAALRGRLSRGLREAPMRFAALYALAKELEDLGEDAAAFAALAEGAALQCRWRRHDPLPQRRLLQSIPGLWGQEQAARLAPVASTRVVFVVGMPRTGSSLLERMLQQHPRMRSAGELTDFADLLRQAIAEQQAVGRRGLPDALAGIDWPALGREYLRGAHEAVTDASPDADDGDVIIIDKMPVNFMYCGLILQALPQARIVHVQREPMDACHAIHKTLFNQAYPFACDQLQLADYYSDYHALMAHWRSLLSGRMHDIAYEQLVTRPAAVLRGVLHFCGLDWVPEVLQPEHSCAPATTASAAQVREPIHTRSLGRWRRHRLELEPLRARLQQAGVVDADGVATWAS